MRKFLPAVAYVVPFDSGQLRRVAEAVLEVVDVIEVLIDEVEDVLLASVEPVDELDIVGEVELMELVLVLLFTWILNSVSPFGPPQISVSFPLHGISQRPSVTGRDAESRSSPQ